MPRRKRERPPQMREAYPGYPHDLLPQDVPLAAWEQARKEVYRFLVNQHLYRFDLEALLTTVYLQGALDGAQVERQLDLGREEAR